jgi:hypothetical protein
MRGGIKNGQIAYNQRGIRFGMSIALKNSDGLEFNVVCQQPTHGFIFQSWSADQPSQPGLRNFVCDFDVTEAWEASGADFMKQKFDLYG